MFPSVPIMGRQVLRETELSNGLILPANTQITIHVFDIHRNALYWDAPDEFRPERFLPENSQDRHTFAYIPFSAGQRNCIGRRNTKYILRLSANFEVLFFRSKICHVGDEDAAYCNAEKVQGAAAYRSQGIYL